ncbi:hypothetical protein ANO11243_044550 [Dothideomycetidae sp. 11243]|nr:hypothetical protein ANO11243_044550 [fungal sp. No.11243]
MHSLFGGNRPWSAADWTASDDRVRGGKSQSHLETSECDAIARFHGDLDISALGGAGFASQRTTDEDRIWDLGEYDGIDIAIRKSDGKRYTLIVKDTLLPPNPDNGREQSTTSYEYDFVVESSAESTSIRIPWSSFNPTYRGREQKDANPLDTTRVRRISIMMRRSFTWQLLRHAKRLLLAIAEVNFRVQIDARFEGIVVRSRSRKWWWDSEWSGHTSRMSLTV